MAAKRIDIMDILQLIQLKLRGESNRSCSKILSIHRNTINYYVRQLKASCLQFSDLLELSDTELRELFPTPNTTDTDRYQELSAYFSYFKKQMLLPGCTRETLWREYLQKHPEGYGYTQFNEHLNKWMSKAKVSGKLNHKAGEKVFVDYCGKKLRIADKESGELRDVEVFVGILPCSGHTFVEASYSQKREDFIGSMNNCLQFYGGSPKAIVTDNLKAAVSKASKYEAVLNKSLKAFALHYNCVVNPTRTYSPQDKALVEGAVKLVYQRIYFPLRNMIFFSLEDLNRQLKTELEKYNNYLMNTYQASRKKLFLDQEQAYLQSLPPAPYQIRHYKRAKVQKMGYIYLSDNKNYYSVPYRYIGKMVELQYNSEMLEIYYQGERISSHKRSQQAGYYSTIKEHLHSSHRFYSEWSPEYFQKLSADVGPNTSTYIGKLIQQQDYPELGYKQALGIIALKKAFSRSRIELACSMAQSHDRYSYRTVKRILENNMDKALQAQPQERSIPIHLNIRGSKAYC